MKKVNCKKGVSVLMAATMSLSMFTATAAGVVNAMFRNVDNSLESQVAKRQSELANIRRQRRNAMEAERRRNFTSTNGNFAIGFSDIMTSFSGTKSENAEQIKSILVDYSRPKQINIPENIIVIIANKLDSAGFSAITVGNIIIKLDHELNKFGNNASECFGFNKLNYQFCAEKILNGELTIDNVDTDKLFKDVLIHTFYDMSNGLANERSLEDKKLVYANTMDILNFIESLMYSYNVH